MEITKTKKGRGTRSLAPTSSMIDEFFNFRWPSPSWMDFGNLATQKTPAANIQERDNEFMIELAIPGFSKRDLNVNLDENVLQVSGETKEKSEEESENYSRREFSYSSFKRSFVLPENINKDNISAECHEGVLKITIPKLESSKRETKQIDID